MSMLRLNDHLAGRFRIDARIAEGGMATVYRGFDQTLDRTIAIKVLRRDAIDDVARFEREAQILATLAHPGVSRYIAGGVADDGARYLVMEWIDGVTLAEHHARVGLSPADGVAVVARVADALGEAHARGLVHRDVKPDNILLAGGDLQRATVIDFGLGRRASGDARLTETGTVVGTPGYMAPEQARGERAIDARSDVFALGCVLYECVTGAIAFAGRNPAAVMARIVLCEPRAVREVWPAVPPALERLLSRMLAKRRDDRPRDAAEVAAELRAIAAPAAPHRRRASGSEAATAVGGTAAAYVVFLHAGLPATPDGAALASLTAPHRGSAHAPADGTAPDAAPDAALDAASDAPPDAAALARPTAPHGGSAHAPADGIAPDAAALAGLVAPFGVSAHALADGTVVAVVPGGHAAAAADCALALAGAFPGALIVLAGPSELPGAAPLAALLDAGAGALELADLQRIFGAAPPPPGSIRVDPITARRLAGQFELRDDGAGAFYLTGRRAP